ncbi:hypothetical protein DMC30DRAFT_185015 [Rhodotorula diobovata]|uniref:Uncharacterized protein n=1 Tax=Rhodotorula diobovata TaxID=5288 RepID=A0A5C5FY42_9BASI|nr:hypothetical protein DMC30DRAFT_185015 [Rhodotorula diobovata]
MPHSLSQPPGSILHHSRAVDAPAATPPSSFLSRMAHFPLLGTGRSIKENIPLDQRGRRFSFGKPREGRGARSPPSSSPAPPLKRSKSARSSLIASARRLSSSAAKRTHQVSSSRQPPVVASPGAGEEGEGFMREYRDRSQLFAMSSPELATPSEEKGEWEAWEDAQAGSSRDAPLSPHSPMVRWAADQGDQSSFVPLSPSSMRPFTASSPDLLSTRRFAETSVTPVDLSTVEQDSSAAGHRPSRRARSPRAAWSVPAMPSPLPSPVPSPVAPADLEVVSRSTSRSPPLDEVVRAANRAEALFKLTSPTPAPGTIPDELAAFPFPPMSTSPPAPPAPPAPTRPLPSLPPCAGLGASSTSLILSPTRTSDDDRPGAPPPLVRSATVGLHPAPVPLDIDFRGQLVRKRNAQPTAVASPSLTMSSSPDSSRFSDWRPSVGSRKSSDTSFTLSAEDDSEVRAPAKTGLYGLSTERRATESAVDVLAIVEEDESPLSSAPPLRAKRSPSKRGPGDSPQRRLSSSSATRKRVSLDSSSSPHSGTDVVVIPRTRPGASPLSLTPPRSLRPPRLSLTDRSLSSGAAVEPTNDEKDELGLRSQPGVPPATKSPQETGPSRPRGGKRCISDLHADLRPSSPERERLYGVGLGLPSSLAATGAGASSVRTRHQSLAFSGDEEEGAMLGSELRPARRASRRVSSGAPTRTKLVLRENGKPVLTYQLGESIGRGQFGSVYRALNLSSGQVVAVKRILLEGKTEQEIEELSGEVKLLRRLSHPSIVRYEGAVRTEHYLNIILEYGESGSLEKTIKQFGQLPELLVASYTVKILEGLAYLHGQGVVHCDLKAANILTTKQGNIKLSDFGVSLNLNAIKATRGFNASTKEANGTPNWMAPEVISLKGALPASDIWSLGATIVELIDGAPPYSGLVAMSAMFRIVEDPEGPPIPDRCSSELHAFLKRCFKKDPKERPTAEELSSDPWLTKHFDLSLDMRPQDSLPFMRRISSDQRRTAQTAPTLSLADVLAESPAELKPPVPPFVASEPQGRTSFDSGYSAGDERATSPERPTRATATATEETCRPHSFVRSSFSKALTCKVCGEQTKRHAVLCQDCGLISHARCKTFAPSCDLRAQLLDLSASTPHLPVSATSTAPPLARFPTLPTSPSSPTGASFAISDYLPFRNSRRPKLSTTTVSQSHTSGSTSNLPATVAAAGGAIRQLLTPGKTRTPDSTPPSSLKRRKSTRPHSCSATGAAAPGGHTRSENASGSSAFSSAAAPPAVPPSSPVSPQGRGTSLDLPMTTAAAATELGLLKRRNSRNVVVVQPGGARALGRRKSHARSVSQPAARVEGAAGSALSRVLSSGADGSGPGAPKGECAVM